MTNKALFSAHTHRRERAAEEESAQKKVERRERENRRTAEELSSQREWERKEIFAGVWLSRSSAYVWKYFCEFYFGSGLPCIISCLAKYSRLGTHWRANVIFCKHHHPWMKRIYCARDASGGAARRMGGGVCMHNSSHKTLHIDLFHKLQQLCSKEEYVTMKSTHGEK